MSMREAEQAAAPTTTTGEAAAEPVAETAGAAGSARLDRRTRTLLVGLAGLVLLALVLSGLVFVGGFRAHRASPASGSASAGGAAATGGTSSSGGAASAGGAASGGGRTLNAPAPDFTLTDQFGHQVSLSQFRGKAVVLAFIDSQCTTICPVTNAVMAAAVRDLGAAGSRVQLLGVNANPEATTQADVRAYSVAHDMLYSWHFLTGTPEQLSKVWHDYNVYDAVTTTGIDHDPAVYVIDPAGREHTLFLSQMSYTSVGVQASAMAAALANALAPDGSITPKANTTGGSAILPGEAATLPALEPGAASASFGPGHPHVVVFVASWLSQQGDLASRLAGLEAYQKVAVARGLPTVVAVDLQTTEPTPNALSDLLAAKHVSLSYPVVADTVGGLADGFHIQDTPWMVLTGSDGSIVWQHDGWASASTLVTQVTKALAK